MLLNAFLGVFTVLWLIPGLIISGTHLIEVILRLHPHYYILVLCITAAPHNLRLKSLETLLAPF